MFVLWLPFVEFTDGVYRAPNADPSIRVGPVTLWPDRDDVWQARVGGARPPWLRMYREFPGLGADQLGAPCRGTVVIANDEQWLRQYYRRLVAVLYFLGDNACMYAVPQLGWPAESFYVRPVAVGAQVHELVEIWTKHGSLLEDENALKLSPPLPVRGHHEAYRLDLRRAENVALTRLIAANAEDRLVTAVLHYYLAQTGDPLVVSFDQDYANYCACLEAAFGIGQGARAPGGGGSGTNAAAARRGCWARIFRLFRPRPLAPPAPLGIYEQLVEHIVAIYGDTCELRDYVRGLYSCRSIHDHGLSDFDPEEVRRDRHQAYLRFRSRRGNFSVCRAICRDVVLRQLWEQPGGARTPMERALAYGDGAAALLHKFFRSTAAWQHVRDRAREQRSAARIAGLAGEELESFRQDAITLTERFDWQSVEPRPSANTVLAVLGVLLDAYTRSAAVLAAHPDSPRVADLVTAFQHGNNEEMGIWAALHAHYPFNVHEGNLTELIVAAAWRVAQFFD